MRLPRQPTLGEREEHECHGHVPFRLWCEFCCTGRGRMMHHKISREEADAHAVISIEYGCLNENFENESASEATASLCVNCHCKGLSATMDRSACCSQEGC
eukprot:6482905-Amphidinium_carterae.2